MFSEMHDGLPGRAPAMTRRMHPSQRKFLYNRHATTGSPKMNTPNPTDVLAALWRGGGHPESALDAIELTGAEPVLPSSFAVGTAAQATIAAAALAAAELWRLRTGRRQRV